MKQMIRISCTLLFAVGVVGCHRGSSTETTVAPQPTRQTYATSTTEGGIIIVPSSSKLAELTTPSVVIKNDTVAISGTVHLRGPYNPDALIRITTLDRHGKIDDEIHASLKETDTNGVLTYSVHFAPVPPKGSSLSIFYDDYHPVSNYSAAYIGAGGAGGGGAAVSTGAGTSNVGKSGGHSSRGRGGK